MNTRILIGVAIVMALAAGGFLAGWFPSRETSPVPQSADGAAPDSVDPFLSEIQTTDSGEMEPIETPDPDTDDDEVLNVRVADEDYYIARTHGKSREYHTATLEEVVSAAQDRPGNEQGVRVRIVGQGASKTSGGRNLQDALIAAGIDPTAIDWGNRARR